MKTKSGIGGKTGTGRAQAYLDGDISLSGAGLNSLYTGLLNTRTYLQKTDNGDIIDSNFNELMTGLKKKGAKAIGEKAEVIPGIELYTHF